MSFKTNISAIMPAQRERASKHMKVWYWPVRIMHWTMVGAFATAMLTRDSVLDPRPHIYAGFVMGGVLVLRVLYGFLANDMAAFRRFPPQPIKGLRYMWNLLHGNARNYLGHNPAGALAIYAMLILGVLTVTTGFTYYEYGFDYSIEWVKDLHHTLAYTWFWVVCVHLFGIAAGSLAHKEFLPMVMVTGHKVKFEERFSLAAAGLTLLMLFLRLLNLIVIMVGGKGFILRK
ncbi:MAG: cytochrome b/b6 domain-containing protein [Methylobacillus sp.]|jgi:cytochrome b|nr:cytochrome b/b6 domain-containing protein [Methylobacillus sp.]